MIAHIAEWERTIIAGLAFYGDPFSASAEWTEENEIGRLWNRLGTVRNERSDEMPEASIRNCMLELHLWDSRTVETGRYEVFAGYPVSDPLRVPPFLLVKVLPPSTCAIFTLAGAAIREQDSYLEIDSWLTEHGRRRSAAWLINRYDSGFAGVDRIEESKIDVIIPIE